MKILVLGDIHSNLHQAESAISKAHIHGIETILQLGDFGIWPGPSGARFRKRLDKILGHFSVHMYFVDGNHEDFPQLYAFKMNPDGTRRVGENITHLPRGHRWEWDGVSFLAMGGAHSVDRPWRVPGQTWWSEETITEADIHRALDVDDPYADVMVCHDSPTDAPNSVVDRNDGHLYFTREELLLATRHRAVLQAVVDVVNPRRLWHGHYHELMSGTFTTSAGHPCQVVGLDEGARFPRANFIIDLEDLRDELTQEKETP